MLAPHHPDALQLLESMARSHPLETDLNFEAWELGFESARMSSAVRTLIATGCIEVEDSPSPLQMRRARITAKGLDLVRASLESPRNGDRRHGNDRRGSVEASPPPGVGERRRPGRDRRGRLRP